MGGLWPSKQLYHEIKITGFITNMAEKLHS